MFSLGLPYQVSRTPWRNLLVSCCTRRAEQRIGVHSQSASLATSANNDGNNKVVQQTPQRLSKVLSSAPNLTMSRREAERLIRSGQVTLAGQIVTQPHLLLKPKEIQAVRLQGKFVQQATGSEIASNNTRVWLVHKLAGELVADFDPLQRPLLLDRLRRGGVGRDSKNRRWHLKPIGRLDVSTEGLLVVTNDGAYAREMELPSHQLHREYRVRVHGLLPPYKLTRIERGMTIEGVRYRGMKVHVDQIKRKKASSTNQWITLTCTEVKVTRLIRTAYGDYQLQTIPPGMAVEVPDIRNLMKKGPHVVSNFFIEHPIYSKQKQ
eukprot:scaffold578_cov167-Amphora_coffeaeformis.AAC.19